MRVGRVIAILVGLAFVVFGLFVLVPSALGLAVVGWDNKVDTDAERLDSPTAALASEIDSIGGDWLTDRPGGDKDSAELTVKSESRGDQELFLGVGPADEVNAYLDQGPWDKVDAFDNSASSDVSKIETKRQGSGDPVALPAPSGQDFWKDEAQPGKSVELAWDFRKGDWSIVLMNADGSPKVDTDTSFELYIPHLNVLLLVGIVFALVLILIGLFLLFKVGRRPPIVG
ncbi:MAG TPA: hypothetical protein VGJ86_24440 [Acidimicrobiales bacterium]|jgi:hypothetical protein